MLNYNKIESCINFQRTSYRKLAEYLDIAESTLRSRLERNNITPNDIEKIADFFEKPIIYFFDRKEADKKSYPDKEEKIQVVSEAGPCKECNALREKIKLLEKINQLQEDKIAQFDRVIEKREDTTQNSAQAG